MFLAVFRFRLKMKTVFEPKIRPASGPEIIIDSLVIWPSIINYNTEGEGEKSLLHWLANNVRARKIRKWTENLMFCCWATAKHLPSGWGSQMKSRHSASSFVERAERAATMIPRLHLQVSPQQSVPRSLTDWEKSASAHLWVQTEWRRLRRSEKETRYFWGAQSVSVPPLNFAVTCSALACQQTVPEWKVWLLAMIETDLIFSPAGAKSNFQLILPNDEPSVRAKYTWEKTPWWSYIFILTSLSLVFLSYSGREKCCHSTS